MDLTTFYAADVFDHEPTDVEGKALPLLAFRRAEVHHGVKLGPMRRVPEEKARLLRCMQAERPSTVAVRVYEADVVA